MQLPNTTRYANGSKRPTNGSSEPTDSTASTRPIFTLIGATTPDDGRTPSFERVVQDTLARTVHYQQEKINQLKSMVSLVEQQRQYDPDAPIPLHAFGQVAHEWLQQQPEALAELLAMHTRLVVDHFLHQIVTDNEDAAALIQGYAGAVCSDICAIAGAEPPPLCNF